MEVNENEMNNDFDFVDYEINLTGPGEFEYCITKEVYYWATFKIVEEADLKLLKSM